MQPLSLFDDCTDHVERSATFSPCGLYRYSLTIRWAPGRTMVVSGINPSTANAVDPDNTSDRCISFAKREHCGALVMVNPFALISTKPAKLLTAEDPVGAGNDAAILAAVEGDPLVVVGWGSWAFGTRRRQERLAPRVRAMLRLLAPRPLWCLGTTGDGHPRHPLYLAANTPLELFNAG